jgi:hypothetical protein
MIKPALILIEEPEKTTREGVNESQSKFLNETWPLSQLRPKPSLFQLGQDYVAIKKLLALRTGLGTTKTQRKTTIDASKVTCETTAIKIRQKISLSPHQHFIEHLSSVFGKPPHESN